MTMPMETRDWVAELQGAIDPLLDEALEERRRRTPDDDARREAEFLAALDRTDPDIELLTRYAEVELSDEKIIEVEDRMLSDPEFARKARVFMWLWQSPISFVPPSVRGKDDHQLPPRRPAPGAGKIMDVAPIGPYVRRIRDLLWVGAIIVTLVAIILSAFLKMTNTAEQRSLAVQQEIHEGRATTVGMSVPRVFSTNLTGTEQIHFLEGQRAVLAPLTRLTYDGNWRVSSDPLVALDGEASFSVPDTATVKGLRLETPAATLHLLPGRYAVRGAPASIETLVTIDSGTVVTSTGARYTAGWIVVRRIGAVRVSPTGEGFPLYRSAQR